MKTTLLHEVNEPDGAEKTFSKIIELINNPNLIDEHKQNSINWIMNKHDVNKVGSFLYQKYDTILNEK